MKFNGSSNLNDLCFISWLGLGRDVQGFIANQSINQSKLYNLRGSIQQWLAYLLLDPAALGLNPSSAKKISEEKIVDVDEVNQLRCLEESGQWLENVDWTQASSAKKYLT